MVAPRSSTSSASPSSTRGGAARGKTVALAGLPAGARRRIETLEGELSELKGTVEVIKGALSARGPEIIKAAISSLAASKARHMVQVGEMVKSAAGVSPVAFVDEVTRQAFVVVDVSRVPPGMKLRKVSSFKNFMKLFNEPAPAEAEDEVPAESPGLAGAQERGEAARVGWVERGEVVQGKVLADAWGLTRQALGPAVTRGELFAVKVGNRLYYPREFLTLEREAVADICKALGRLSSSEKLIFWTRPHGSLAGKTVGDALQAGVPQARVVALARAWAAERGAEVADTAS